MKLPAFQFYPGDWLKDANLRRCSHAAKGVWIDMLCLMFEADERGVLATNGVAWSDEDIACAIGGDTTTTISAIQELTFKGVAKRRSNGAVYSKRMVADENKRQLCSAAGKKGGGNPNLTQKDPTFKGQPKGGSKGESKGGSKQNPNPSSSSSSSDNNNPPYTGARGFTLEQVLDAAQDPSVCLSKDEATAFFDHYETQGWLKSNGQAITSLAGVMRNWKRKLGEFRQQKGGNNGTYRQIDRGDGRGSLNNPDDYA